MKCFSPIWIPLTKGKCAVIDEPDFALVGHVRWHAICGKVTRTHWSAHRVLWHHGPHVAMHRVIIGALPGQEVDHVNRNGLDNRRANLRICSHRNNTRNRLSGMRKTSQFHGVSWHAARSKWRAVIAVVAPGADGARHCHLGYFDNEADAARAYDRAALQHFGEFATTNFPREEYAA